MAIYDWKDEYSIGIRKIDDQHKIIVDLMNDLLESIRAEREEYIIKDVLEELSKYSSNHFRVESELFTRFKYDNAEEHLKEHGYFNAEIGKLKAELNNKIEWVSEETLHYLCEWFSNHMLKTDMKYSNFFKKIGVINSIDENIK